MSAADGAGAVAAAVAQAAGDGAGDEQLELLPPSRFAEGKPYHVEMVEAVRRHGAGRPPGARNIATRDAVAFIRRVIGDPMIESARWLSHTPETLARELRCTPIEAFDRLERIRADLRRFMYAPLAPVDGHGNAVVPRFELTIGGAVAGGPGRVPWDYEGGPQLVQETQQNQALLASPPVASQTAASHENAK